MMPEGIRRNMVLLPLIHSVWPALWPPWKRTTPWADSASQSTILPLPSSPHWVPITTIFLLISSIDSDAPGDLDDSARQSENPYDKTAQTLALLNRPHLPFITLLHEFAIEHEFVQALFLARQDLHHDGAPGAQVAQGRRQCRVATPRRTHRLGGRGGRQPPGQGAQIETEAGRRPGTAECLADAVVAATAHERVAPAIGVDGEHDAGMIAVARADVGKIEADVVARQ